MRVSGGVSAQSEFKTDRDALEGVASPRPGQPAFLHTTEVDVHRSITTVLNRVPPTRKSYRPRSAVVIDMCMWKRDHAALRSNTGVSIRAKNS